jgi:hypothetical protein
VQKQNLVEPCDFEYLPHQACQTADAKISAFFPHFLSDHYKGTEPHRADIFQLAQINDKAGDSFGDAGFTLTFEKDSVLSVHTTSHVQHYFTRDFGALNYHSVSRVPSGGPNRQSESLQKLRYS